MYPFAYVRASDLPSATRAAQDPSAEYIAGGTDMLQLLKDDVRRPARIVDLNSLRELARIDVGPLGLRLGALARMSDVADHPAVRERFPVLSQALLASASPQVRNMGTMGGNLLQRTRCPYFRDVATACNKREAGTGCSAIDGENRIHAVLGGSAHCVATHPSDMAVALVALDATVVTLGPNGERRIPIEGFHLVPGETPDRENVLAQGELITAIEVPETPFARRSLYRKVRDRASFEFALAAAAVALAVDGGRIREARVALGGVATKPWRSYEAERALTGAPLEATSFERAAALAVGGTRPLAHNAYKIALARRTLAQTLAAAGA
jgi:xanthine dehydrogenase YagS FAD-binding subunit